MKTKSKKAIKLSRSDMLQVWRDAVVGSEVSISRWQKRQYDRISAACDAALKPKKKWVNPYLSVLPKTK